MTHQGEGEVVYLIPSAQDEVNRQRAMRAIVVSSLGLLVTSAFELYITVLSGSVACCRTRCTTSETCSRR